MLKSTLTMLSVLGERMKARDPRRSPCGGRDDPCQPAEGPQPRRERELGGHRVLFTGSSSPQPLPSGGSRGHTQGLPEPGGQQAVTSRRKVKTAVCANTVPPWAPGRVSERHCDPRELPARSMAGHAGMWQGPLGGTGVTPWGGWQGRDFTCEGPVCAEDTLWGGSSERGG